jgi:hypothetical protein
MKLAKQILGAVRDVAYVVWGWVAFAVTGKTPPDAHQGMVRLFCRTGGRSNDLVSWMVSAVRPPYRLPGNVGVLGEFDADQLTEIGSQLRKNGYYVFRNRLPVDLCDRLMSYALDNKCETRLMDAEIGTDRKRQWAIYNPAEVKSVRYDFAESQVINIPDVQALLSDFSIIGVAQEYLGCRPVADVSALWWHTAYGAAPDKEAAQYFHFDLDRLKWLKFFFYLTDVTTDNGPHSFVAGSHRTGGIPRKLLRRGYARLDDGDVGGCYPPEAFIEFVAPRGTVIAEDTRGLHKGKHVHSGHRLMLQLQFSNSLFGASYAAARFSTRSDPRLMQVARLFPAIYANFMPAVDIPATPG